MKPDSCIAFLIGAAIGLLIVAAAVAIILFNQ